MGVDAFDRTMSFVVEKPAGIDETSNEKRGCDGRELVDDKVQVDYDSSSTGTEVTTISVIMCI